MKTTQNLFLLSLVTLASLWSLPVMAGTIYDRPILPAPTGDARLYVYDPVTHTDRNVTWDQVTGLTSAQVSPTPAPNKIPRAGADGKLDPAWQPVASAARLGMVKVGPGLEIDATGTLYTLANPGGGATVINFRDDWLAAPVSYSAASNDVVYRDGTSYRCVQDNTGIDPATDTLRLYWYPLAKGSTGAAATVAVGGVTTGAAGTSAAVTNVGTPSAALLNFTIPRGADGAKGDKGDKGDAATVAAGTTTTGAANSAASVTNVGTPSAAVFNFTIPQGIQGIQGVPGTPGAKGDKGDQGPAGPGVIAGGTTGQVYAKKSNADYDGQYVTLGGAASLNVGTGPNTVAAGNDVRFAPAPSSANAGMYPASTGAALAWAPIFKTVKSGSYQPSQSVIYIGSVNPGTIAASDLWIDTSAGEQIVDGGTW